MELKTLFLPYYCEYTLWVIVLDFKCAVHFAVHNLEKK